MKLMSLRFRHRSPFVEKFNRIIAERGSFIANQLSENGQSLSKRCRDHLFPDDADPAAHFNPLSLKLMSATMVVRVWFFRVARNGRR